MKWPYHERKLKYLFHFDHAKAFKCNAVLRTRHFKIGWFLKYVYSIEIQLTMILHFFLFQVDRRDCLHCILCINQHNNLAQIQKRLYDFWIEPTVPPFLFFFTILPHILFLDFLIIRFIFGISFLMKQQFYTFCHNQR